MTDDAEKHDGEAAPERKGIPLSALAEEMAEEATWHRSRKLHRAVQVDELRAHVTQLEADKAALVEQVEKLTAALEKATVKSGEAS